MSRISEKLRESIEEDVATGKLLPGTHLDEIELAQRYGVSRTPIREAISLLAGEGLVEIRPRRGAVVASVTPRRLLEMFEVMAELEGMCARLAARRITDPDLEKLLSAHQECLAAAEKKSSDEYFYANERFHQAIYAAAQNHFLMEQATALQRRLRPYRRLQLRVRNRMQNSFDEHQVILDAIQAGDAARVTDAMKAHVTVQGERFTDLLASLPTLQADTQGSGS
ncbi:MAG: GntR family transcriptional regulator [Pseudomonadota bacterium]